MKKTGLHTIISLIILQFIANSALAYVGVKGHFKKSGGYTRPHYRTNPDGHKVNNWSTQGNTNPFTGKRGYKKPY
jgi:hypothetical protein